MEKSFLLRHVLFLFFLVLLLFPVFFLPLYVPLDGFSWDPFFLQVLYGAVVQSLLSTGATLLLGALGVFGLFAIEQKLSEKAFQAFQLALLLPSFIPPIIVVALATKTLGFLPTQLLGVVFFHSLMNVGLVTLLFYRLILRKAGYWIRDARLFNLPPVAFFTRYLLKEFRFYIRWWAFYFFILYFFSFAIPFLVGGSQFGGLEVFIYEKVLFFGQWSEALQYSIVLFLLLIAVSKMVREPQTRSHDTLEDGVDLSYLALKPFMVVALFPVGFLGWGLVLSLASNFSFLFESHWLSAFQGTLVVGLSVGLLVFTFLSVLTYCFVLSPVEKLLLAFVHPGWVFVGFAFMLLGGHGVGFEVVKIVVALAIVYLPFLYRLQMSQKLHTLKQQVRLARTFDVPWSRTFSQILWPQTLPTLALLSGIAALWACGDFAMTGLISQSPEFTTLAYEMKTLLSNYRIERAILLLWPLLMASTLVFFAFQGIVFVSSRKRF